MPDKGKDLLEKLDVDAIRKKYKGKVLEFWAKRSKMTAKCIEVKEEKTVVLKFKPWLEHLGKVDPDTKKPIGNGYSNKTPNVERLSDMTKIKVVGKQKFQYRKDKKAPLEEVEIK